MCEKTWARLPVELVWQIFSLFDTGSSDLIQCQQTCKAWKRTAQITFYKTIYLDFRDINRTKKLMKVLSRSEGQLGELVKHVILRSLDYIYDAVLLEAFLSCLGKNCPNVKTIHSNLEWKDEFWNELAKKEWRFLEGITFDRNSIACSDSRYVKTALLYKHTLKTLEVCTSTQCVIDITTEETNDKIFDSFKEELDMFTSLQNLTVIVNTNNNIFQFDSLIPHRLKSLKMVTALNNGKLISPEKGKEVFDRSMTKIRQCFDLKQVELSAVFNSNDSLEYMMYKFPNVKNLCVNRHQYSPATKSLWKQSIFHMSKNTINKFSEYLANINQFEIDNIYVDNQMDFLETLVRKSKSEKARYYLSLDHNRSQTTGSNNLQTITVSKNAEYLQSEIRNSGIDLYYINANSSSNTLHSEGLWSTVGNHLVGLKIKERLNDDLSRKKVDLDPLFDKCPNLKSLEIHNADPLLCRYSKMKENTSIETLALWDCTINIENFVELPKCFPDLTTLCILGSNKFVDSHGNKVVDIELSNITANFHSLNALELHNPESLMCSSSEIKQNESIETLVLWDRTVNIEIFQSLSKRFPNLTSLRLLECDNFIDSYHHKILYVDLSEIAANFPNLKALEVNSFKLYSYDPRTMNKNKPREQHFWSACKSKT